MLQHSQGSEDGDFPWKPLVIDSAPASLDSSPISQREGVSKRKREDVEEEEREMAETDEDYPTPYQECQLKGDSEDAQRVSETESEQSL